MPTKSMFLRVSKMHLIFEWHGKPAHNMVVMEFSSSFTYSIVNIITSRLQFQVKTLLPLNI
jgi:hypothetical protein